MHCTKSGSRDRLTEALRPAALGQSQHPTQEGKQQNLCAFGAQTGSGAGRQMFDRSIWLINLALSAQSKLCSYVYSGEETFLRALQLSCMPM